MPVEVIGDYPILARARTGLFSLDLALGQSVYTGIPRRTVTELYGYPNSGKSTLAYYLSSKLTGKGNVSVADIEMADLNYVSVCMENGGLDGQLKFINTFEIDKGVKKPRHHEGILLELVRDLYNEDYGAAILDSVGVVQANVEADVLLNLKDEELGQAFMGKRAKLIAQMARAMQMVLRNKERESNAFVITHVHSLMGSQGHGTAGGDTIKFVATQRIMLYTKETFWYDPKTKEQVLGYLVAGQIEKLRYGARGGKFQFYIVPGYGVHAGVSAMFDCFDYGLAERGARVKLGDTSMGYLNKTLLAAAANGNTRKFESFEAALRDNEKRIIEERLTIETTD